VISKILFDESYTLVFIKPRDPTSRAKGSTTYESCSKQNKPKRDFLVYDILFPAEFEIISTVDCLPTSS